MFLRLRLLLVLLLGALPCTCVRAQNVNAELPNDRITYPLPHAINYGVNDGLPSSEVYVVLQDQRGYMWFGTDNGVARYDGYNFKSYGPNEGLEDPIIFSIKEGPDGKVYACAGFSGQIFIWDERRDQWTNYVGNVAIAEAIRWGEYGHIKIKEVLSDGTIRLDVYNLGCISVKDGVISYNNNISGYGRTTMIENPVVSITRASFKPKTLKETERDLKVFSFKSPGGKLIAYDSIPDAGFYRPFGLLDISASDTSYVIGWMEQNGVSWLKYVGDTSRYQITYRKDSPLFQYFISDGGFYLGQNNGVGLHYYESMEAFKQGRSRVVLADCNASYMTMDQNEGLWVTTTDRGVFYLPAVSSKIYNQQQGYSPDKLIAVDVINEGGLILGYEDFSVCLTRREGKDWQVVTAVLSDVPQKATSFFYDSITQVVYGSTYRIDINKKRVLLNGGYLPNLEELRYTGGLLTARYRRYNDTLLLAAGLKGPITFSTRLNAPLVAYSNSILEKQEHDNLKCYDYQILPDGTHLTASNDGLYRWERYDTLIREDFGFSELNVRIVQIEVLPDSSLLLGTRGRGILHLYHGELYAINRSNGLSSDFIRDIEPGPDGIFYVSTFNGLSVLRIGHDSYGKPVYQLRRYATAHGLPTNEVHQVAVGNGGKVWVATSKGLVDFRETPVDTASRPPELRRLLVNEKPWLIDGRLVLSRWQNNLQIEYSTIDFRMGGDIPYRYRLKPRAEWIRTKKRTLNLIDLPPGRGYFEVQSQNRDGKWSSSEILHYTIQPEWYETIAARFVALLALLGGVVVLMNTRQRRLEAKVAVERRIQDLERAALQAQMNPHFVFNCLNSINNFIQKNEGEQASFFLTKFAKLVRQTLNLSVEGGHTLYDEVKMLDNYLALEKLRFKKAFNYAIKVDSTLDELELMIPPLLVQPYVENAILHGMKGRSDGGWVEIAFRAHSKGLEVIVKDNGIGSYSEKEVLKDYKSYGTDITKQRLELLSKEKNWRSVWVESNTPEPGITVRLLIRI